MIVGGIRARSTGILLSAHFSTVESKKDGFTFAELELGTQSYSDIWQTQLEDRRPVIILGGGNRVDTCRAVVEFAEEGNEVFKEFVSEMLTTTRRGLRSAMLHDAPNLNEARFVRAAERIFDRYKDEFYEIVRRPTRIVVAIAGGSGTGKTSIACVLCRLIDEDPRCSPAMIAKHLYADNLYIDNYRGDMPGLRELRRKEAHYAGIGPAEYNWTNEIFPYDNISRVISTFKGDGERRVCTIPCVDVLNQQIDELKIDFNQEIGKLTTDLDGPVPKKRSSQHSDH